MAKELFYNELAYLYDTQYKDKNYEKEVAFLQAAIKKHTVKGKRILDVCCGTMSHSEQLVKKEYSITGVDINTGMLALARKKVKVAKLYKGDMKTFNLKKKFDIIICLFTSMNYNTTEKELVKTLKNLRKHLAPGGIIIYDTNISYSGTRIVAVTPTIDAIYDAIPQKDKSMKLVLCWILRKKKERRVIKDTHHLRLFTLKEQAKAIKKAGLKHKVYWDWSLRKRKGKRPITVCWV